MDRLVEQIDYPKTAGEWWALLEAHRAALLGLVTTYHPDCYRVHGLPITAGRAEAICERVRQDIRLASAGKPRPAERFEEYLRTRDPAMAGLLNEAWFGMPESAEVRTEDGFGTLCDLCSESWVLEPMPEN